MKAIKVDLPKDLQFVELYTLSDLHFGDKNCNYDEISKIIDKIQTSAHAYVILNGDLINNATTQSISDTYSEIMSPMQQLKMVKSLLEPIKDKIIAITSGNHENRTYKTDGIDLTEILAIELGLANRYSPESATIFLKIGDRGTHYSNRPVHYVIYVTHGSGGGRREGGKINRLVDLASIIDADIYIHSHTHLPAALKQAFYRSNPATSTINLVDKLFVNTNAWLNYGGYGESHGYKHASISTPIVYLSGSRKDFTAKL